MNTFRGILLLSLILSSAAAQPAAKTAPKPDYRVVDGKLYNAALSVLWQPFEGECLAVLKDGIVMQKIEYNRVYAPIPVSESESVGAYRSGPPLRRIVSETRIPGKKSFVKNYPLALRPQVGQAIKGKAMQAVSFSYNGEPLDTLDWGVPYSDPSQIKAPVTAASPAAPAAVAAQTTPPQR